MSYFDKLLWQDGRHLATPLVSARPRPTTVELLQSPLIDADWLAKADVAVYRFEEFCLMVGR